MTSITCQKVHVKAGKTHNDQHCPLFRASPTEMPISWQAAIPSAAADATAADVIGWFGSNTLSIQFLYGGDGGRQTAVQLRPILSLSY